MCGRIEQGGWSFKRYTCTHLQLITRYKIQSALWISILQLLLLLLGSASLHEVADSRKEGEEAMEEFDKAKDESFLMQAQCVWQRRGCKRQRIF